MKASFKYHRTICSVFVAEILRHYKICTGTIGLLQSAPILS